MSWAVKPASMKRMRVWGVRSRGNILEGFGQLFGGGVVFLRHLIGQRDSNVHHELFVFLIGCWSEPSTRTTDPKFWNSDWWLLAMAERVESVFGFGSDAGTEG